MKKKTKTLLTAVAIPLAVGGVSGFLTRNSMEVFRKLKKPPLAPPGWLFPDCVDDFVLSHGNRVMDHLGVAAHQKADRSPAGLRDTAGGQFFLAFIFLPWQMV